MKFASLPLALAAFLAMPAQAQQATYGASPAQVEADVRFLADDLLEGREAGTRGYDVAAAYVASRFAGLGLEPAGEDGGWYQQVGLREATLDAEASSLAIMRGGETIALDAKMALPRPSLAAETVHLEAPMVFVGRGIDAPELGHDDFDGVDVAGKIVVYLDHMPSDLGPDYRGHLNQYREEMAARYGAVGIVSISAADVGRAARTYNFYATRPRQSWIGEDGRSGDLPEGMKLSILTTREGAEAIMAGAPVALDELIARAEAGEKLPSFDLPGTLSATAVSTFRDYTSPNVVARIAGSDPDQADEHVVMVAHLDHVGIDEKAGPGEDAIHNGALDNAAGVATMLEAARLFAEAEGEARPDRSMLFIAVTAEEKGLLGAEYFAEYPTVPLDSIVADLSLDMPVPLYSFTDVVAFGSEHGSIADYIRGASETMSVSLSPDPMPEQAIFVRSDHYVFAKKGIPAVLLFTGYGNGGEAVWGEFFANRYHKPGDDLSQDFHWDALARYAALNFRIASAIAEDDDRPLWYEGNFFGNAFAPDAEKAPKR